jgi:hypothetical protein
MIVRLLASAALAAFLGPAVALAQYAPPVPLYPGTAPKDFDRRPLPPVAPPQAPMPASAIPEEPPAPQAAKPVPVAPPVGPAPSDLAAQRVFCDQSVPVRVAPRDAVPPRYRPFLGIWSDASWTPQLCAALIVENVTPDGTARITYVFGPMGSGNRTPGGILHGTGVIRNGELRFQNSDGSQYAFHPAYADLEGRYTTPQGQKYGAIFKKAL